MRLHRLVIIVLDLLAVLALAAPGPAAAAIDGGGAPGRRPAQVEPARCMFPLPAGAKEGVDVECGYLSVPETRANPGGPSIRLAYAVVKKQPTRNSVPADDPVFMLQGGPGGSTIDTYAKRLLADNPFGAERDVVIFDQRGTLYSQPALMCSESYSLTLQTLEQRLGPDESERLNQQAMSQCRSRLAGEGVNLAAFNSLENAADIEALRQALGYDWINLYGVSYGTLLALHTLRDFPGRLRSVVLDGLVPPQVNFRLDGAQTKNRVFSELFNACAADADCAAAFPDLERVFFDLVQALNDQPARVPLTDPETGKVYNTVLDGDSLISVIFQMLYVGDLIPALPKVIYDARAGRFGFLSRIMALLVFDHTLAEGMYLSVMCAEDADYRVEDIHLAGVRPQLAELETRDEQGFLKLCALWNVPYLGARLDQPVTSDVPALLFSGRFDPVTPPAYAAEAARTLSRSASYTFPTGGHGQFLSDACATRMAKAFIDDPSADLDAGCINDKPLVKFITPATVLMTPATGTLLRVMDGAESNAPIGLYAAGALMVLTLFLIWPVAWVIRLLRERRGDRRWPARFARYLAVFNALLITLFPLGVTALVLATSFTGNDMLLLFGAPAQAAVVFVLPLAILALTTCMTAFTIVAWLRRYWNLAGRLYYSVLTAAAVACVAALVQLGLVLPLFDRVLGRA